VMTAAFVSCHAQRSQGVLHTSSTNLNTLLRPREMTLPATNDPLAGLTPKQIWHDCVWISDESAQTKLFLLCVGRFMSADLESSDMSYTQIKEDCSLSERFTKAAAKRARDRWLKIEVGKGRLTRNGRQNLYHGIIPPDVAELLRARKSKGLAVASDPTLEAAVDVMVNGVHVMHPSETGDGVHVVHPNRHDGVHGRGALGAPVHQEAERGACGAPLLTKTPTSLSHSGDSGTLQREVPHMNGKGFVISAEHDLYIPNHVLDGWRTRFPDIADLDAKVQKLAGYVQHKGTSHPGWSDPESWMVGLLAEDNAAAKQRKMPRSGGQTRQETEQERRDRIAMGDDYARYQAQRGGGDA
jgi:hypothetical protein